MKCDNTVLLWPSERNLYTVKARINMITCFREVTCRPTSLPFASQLALGSVVLSKTQKGWCECSDFRATSTDGYPGKLEY